MVEVFLVFFRLGLTSFGGPVAHLGYFHNEFVKRREWLSEQAYADLVALCQFLPGPASSQVGIAVGLSRAGVLGAIAAWLGFTLPSALFLTACGLGMAHLEGVLAQDFLHGLKLVAVPIVAQAIWSMGKKLCVGKIRLSIAIGAAFFVGILPFGFAQIGAIVLSAMIGWFCLNDEAHLPHTPIKISISKRTAAVMLSVFVGLLLLLPILAKNSDVQSLKVFDSFFRSGSLVFGGGHVVLPLLKSEVVPSGWVSNNAFMAGYGLTQAVPGPLFTFTAYLGAVMQQPPNGWLGAGLCLLAAFLPSFFLVFGTLPFWEQIRTNKSMRSAMQGINAAVVGLLLAAFYNPVWTSSVISIKDFAIALFAFLLLEAWKWPSWLVVFVVVGAATI